ncbi:hypothetical protein BDW22DRAFT_1351472 [Trametopsis cervina]|nr:hypothetical protein BDW22DRAFT_1351472 [Trametopsis cervina]
MRRAQAPSLPIQPPPPYAPPGPMDMILNSPISVTTQLVSARSPDTGKGMQPLSPAMEEWMHEKSREELSNLLVAAGDMIKSRETELSLTSTFCKNLYQDNISLKTKHDALVARIPGQDISPSPSPTGLLSPLPTEASPHYYSVSRPGSPTSTSPTATRHVRRVSVTPGELSILADQNAELLGKLEKLEEESAQADMAGKRKLRKLEKEIAGLRTELDKTREKGEELEQNLKKRGIGLTPEEEEEAKRKREEREERLKALKEKSGPVASASETSLQDIKDFAPAPELPRARTASNAKAPAINLGTKPSPLSIQVEGTSLDQPPLAVASPSEDSSYFPLNSSFTGSSLNSSTSQPAPQLEYALVAQLLAKIKELEDANTQITQEQKATGERLQAAQRDVESIRRAYEYLGDDLQIITEDQEEADAPGVSSSPMRNRIPTGSTIKFSSLRRTIADDASQLSLMDNPDDIFAAGITKHSTTRSSLGLGGDSPVQQKGKVAGQKTRKSLVGLFDVNPGPGDAPKASSSQLYPSKLSVAPNFRSLSPIPFPAGAADMSVWSTAANDSFEDDLSPPVSPSLSAYASPLMTLSTTNLDLLPGSSSLGTSSGAMMMHSLGSELGSEFGDDWGERAGNHHLRATSIADMSAFWNNSAAATPSSPAFASELVPPSPSTSPQSDSVWEDVDESPRIPATSVTSTTGTEVGTPTKSRGSGLQLQFVVDPPTPSPTKISKVSPSYRSSPLVTSVSASALSLRESRSSRNLRLTQTMKARTSRWVERVERRYMDSPLEDAAASSQAILRRRRSLMGMQKRQRKTSTTLDDTFDEVVHTISRSFSTPSAEFGELAEEDPIDGDSGITLRREVVVPSKEVTVRSLDQQKKKPGFVGFVLEVWLWLQFAIIVGMFLWAMARRGPKTVLEDAERRRVDMQRSSRR